MEIWKNMRCEKQNTNQYTRYCLNICAGGKWLEAMELREAVVLEENDNFFLHPHTSLVSTLFSQWFHGEGSHHADCGDISLEDEEAPPRREGKIIRANIPPWVETWRNYQREHVEEEAAQFSGCGHSAVRVKQRRHASCLFVRNPARNKHSANGLQCCL